MEHAPSPPAPRRPAATFAVGALRAAPWFTAGILFGAIVTARRPEHPQPAAARAAAAAEEARLAEARAAEEARGRAGPELFPCAEGELRDGVDEARSACFPLPSDEAGDEGIVAPTFQNAHREKSGRWARYEQISRLPERPADYDAYVYPIPPGMAGGHFVVSGYDLHLDDAHQRRGKNLSHVGHGGLDLPQAKGTPIKMVPLEHQEGDAIVVFTGKYFGTTVITLHTVREGGGLREYLLFFGHLDRPVPGIHLGMPIPEGQLVGYVGDTGSPELVHLHYEVRRMREHHDDLLASVRKIGAGYLADDAISIICDPRNVLPLRAP